MSSAWNWLSSAASHVSSDVSSAAHAAGSALSTAASATGSALSSAAKATGSALSSANASAASWAQKNDPFNLPEQFHQATTNPLGYALSNLDPLHNIKAAGAFAYDTVSGLVQSGKTIVQHPQMAADVLSLTNPVGAATAAAQGIASLVDPSYGKSMMQAVNHPGSSFGSQLLANSPTSAIFRIANDPKTALNVGGAELNIGLTALTAVGGIGAAGKVVESVGADALSSTLARGGADALTSSTASGVTDAVSTGVKSVLDAGAGYAADAGHVFWSGGNAAKDAAMEFATGNGLKTLEMTPVGQTAEKVAGDLQKAGAQWQDIRPVWEAASKWFAENTQGTAHAFLRVTDPDRFAQSVWSTVERPILEGLQQAGQVDQIVLHHFPFK